MAIQTALQSLDGRFAGRVRALQGDPRRADPAGKVAVLEAQLLGLLAELPGAVLSTALDGVAALGASRRAFDPEPVRSVLLSAFDRVAKTLLQVPAQRLGKLPATAAELRTQSHARLKRSMRSAREVLEQRIQQHAERARAENQQRRTDVRLAVQAQRGAEQRARQRARLIWWGLTLACAAALLGLWLRQQWRGG